MTAEHDAMQTLHILTHVPEHAPREDDPHYRLFEAAKARLKRQGLWKCVIGDSRCGGEMELHHTHVEFSLINSADPLKIQQALGLHFESDEDFQKWAESPGNLEVLCATHHRTKLGVHVLPAALWEANRWMRDDTAAAGEFVAAKDVPK